MIKADLHVHTIYSKDAFLTLRNLISVAIYKKIKCIAITDHNEIRGALKLRKIAPFKIIVGQEIMTSEGEIIGLFLSNRIESGLSPEKTIEEIRKQGGLVYLPHPFSGTKKRKGIFPINTLHRIAKSVDIVEVMNSRGIDMKVSIEFAQKYELLMGAGSDAHTPFEIGNAYVEMEPFLGKEDFLDKLKRGKIRGKFTPKWYRMLSNRFVRKGLRSLVSF